MVGGASWASWKQSDEQQEQEVRGPVDEVVVIEPALPVPVEEDGEIVDDQSAVADDRTLSAPAAPKSADVSPPSPDDPGVDLDEGKTQGRGFRLF